jgi:uncharacterized membrane protein
MSKMHIIAAIIISATMLSSIRRSPKQRLPGHLLEWAVVLIALYLIGLWAFPFWFLYSATRGGINVARGHRDDGTTPAGLHSPVRGKSEGEA